MRRSALTKVPSFSRNEDPGQEDVGELGGLVQEEILDDDALHGAEGRLDVLGVRVRLGDVLALDVERLEIAGDGVVEHVRNPEARLRIEVRTPMLGEDAAHRLVVDGPVAGELVRERAHVAGALDVVLAAQRVDADAGAADVAGGHGEIGHRHDHGRALAVLGDAESVVDGAVAALGVQACGGADVVGRYADRVGDVLRRVDLVGGERQPVAERLEVAAFLHEVVVDQVFRDDDVCEGVHQRHVGAGLERQVVIGFDVRRAHEGDLARVADDELGALT